MIRKLLNIMGQNYNLFTRMGMIFMIKWGRAGICMDN